MDHYLRTIYSHIYIAIFNFKVWVANLDLYYLDKDVIEAPEGLLCDRHMHAAHKLLSNSFPDLQGLQSTLLCQNGGYTPVTSDDK